MKVDRILGIIIYLMNHDNVSASYLAERFHVSVRTIQRDIVSISSIGIPVYAEGISDTVSSIEHDNIEKLMKDSEQAYYETCIHIEVQFDHENACLMSEYFPDCQAEKLTETTSRIFIDVPPKERLWKALLLSFGDQVKVAGPEEYKNELIETAKKFLSNYDI